MNIANPACGSCELQCGFSQAETKLGSAIDAARASRDEAELGSQIAQDMARDVDTDIALEKLMADATGTHDDSITAGTKASERIQIFEAVGASAQENIRAIRTTTAILGAGPTILEGLVGQRELLARFCPGPKQPSRFLGFLALLRLRKPVTTPTCGSPSARIARGILKRSTAFLESVLADQTPQE